ncbi:MAG TPA: redoxin family protein [Pyrinomonadaceae bacterium]|nr:redoxin family protein [Pyrinomonadaceae bacterium]
MSDENGGTHKTEVAAEQLSNEGQMPSLAGAKDWLNSPKLITEELRGKVVLVSFWTYTCINWLRTDSYLKAWAEKYKGQGLVVIGVHSPEFEFEKDVVNVRRAAADLEVDYPIAVDSDQKVWRAFNNRYWPAFYFVDSKGQIRHHRFGEGDYERSERVIQQLLAEAGGKNIPTDLVVPSGQGVKAEADWKNLRSGENYLGYERTANFASLGGVLPDKSNQYAVPSKLLLNQWAIAGEWKFAASSIKAEKPNGRIAYRFHARDVHLVMGSTNPAIPVRFRILIDGKPPGSSRGIDVDADGHGKVLLPRMYQLIRQQGEISDVHLEIEFLDAGVEIFAFTFG